MKIRKKKKLLEDLRNIPDYRIDVKKIKYPLHEILFMALFAMIKGYSQYKEMVVWMQYNAENELFKRLFQKKIINIPCKSTLHNMLTNVDNEALEKIFRKYFGKYVEQKNIAIDGKWLRGSDINGQYVKEGHQAILNVLDKDTKIVFAHKLLDYNVPTCQDRILIFLIPFNQATFSNTS